MHRMPVPTTLEGWAVDWRKAADAHGVTVEQLKEKLSLEWVVSEAAGIGLEPDGDGRAHGFCPFHEDTNPSLDVYGYGTRWGCFPCGEGGDIYDFIGSFWQLDSFGARFERGVELLRGYEAEEWSGLITSGIDIVPVDQGVIDSEVNWARGNAEVIKYPIVQLLQNKHLDIPVPWLVQAWGLGVDENYDVVAPYFRSDGIITSLKTRNPERGGWYARKGRQLNTLYGEHLLGDAPNVWLTEGETDTWLASWLLQGRGVALGLPSGAGAQIDPQWVDLLSGRNVTIVFDADVAGRRAAIRWYEALNGIASEIKVSFPAGDLCETPNPLLTLDSGLVVEPPSGYIIERPDRGAYLAVTRNTGAPGDKVCNWVFDPTRYITYLTLDGKLDLYGFEGYLTNDSAKRRLIRDSDLRNSQTAADWSNKQRRSWFASGQKMPQAILNELTSQAPFLPLVRGVSMIGLHGVEEGMPVFVLPDGAGGIVGSPVAAERWIAYEDGTAADYSDFFSMPSTDMDGAGLGEWGAVVIQALLELNQTWVTTPILAWLCAAPLRSTTREFPPLGVIGGSGSGKTTMLQWMLWAFYGVKEEHNLSDQSTAYGLTSWATGTNALPVWYDEYRASVKREALDAVNQMLRDAWTASSSSRGGMGEDKTKVRDIRITAPIIVSGEGAFAEQSHIDRMVIITLPDQNAPDGRGMDVGALDRLISGLDGVVGVLGRLYLEWVTRRLTIETLPEVQVSHDRQTQGENVLRWGWAMWCEFCLDVFGVQIKRDGLDLSGVMGERAASDESPVLTALGDCLDEGIRDRGDKPIAWIVDEGGSGSQSLIAVRPHQFHLWAQKNGYELPSTVSKGTASWLSKRFLTAQNPSGRVSWSDPFGKQFQPRGLYLVGVLEEIGHIPSH